MAQHCSTDNGESDNDSFDFTDDERNSINGVLIVAGWSSTAIERFWQNLHYANADEIKKLRQAYEKSLPKNRIDDITKKFSRYAQYARYAGFVILIADGVNGTISIIDNPSPSNIAVTAADVTISAYATFGPKGLLVGLTYHSMKYHLIMTHKGFQDGSLILNPYPVRGITPGLAPVHVIPNY